MRSHLLPIAFLLSSSTFCVKLVLHQRLAFPKSFSDFTIHRLSNERVFVSWHTTDDAENVTYEVLRKHHKTDLFISLGVVQPKSVEVSTADYAFVDVNDFPDSSYYCLKKTNTDKVIFYSVTRGVEGITGER
jgi:hypothetical protein